MANNQQSLDASDDEPSWSGPVRPVQAVETSLWLFFLREFPISVVLQGFWLCFLSLCLLHYPSWTISEVDMEENGLLEGCTAFIIVFVEQIWNSGIE